MKVLGVVLDRRLTFHSSSVMQLALHHIYCGQTVQDMIQHRSLMKLSMVRLI